MKKVLFLLTIVITLFSCGPTYKPINEVKMDVIEQKFIQDTTKFDSYVKITDNTYYFYTLDDKELYAKVDINSLISETIGNYTALGMIIAFIIGIIFVILMENR